MDRKIIIAVAAIGGVVLLMRVLKTQTSQATNTAAANTSGSASALLSGLLSGWANPASTVPSAAVVAANGTVSTPAPAPAPVAVSQSSGWGGVQNQAQPTKPPPPATSNDWDTPQIRADRKARLAAIRAGASAGGPAYSPSAGVDGTAANPAPAAPASLDHQGL